MKIDMEPFTKGLTKALALLTEKTENVELIPGNPKKMIIIGAGLEEPLLSKIIELIRVYIDIFPWSSSDMSGIDELVAIHRLSVDLSRKAIM